jgi:hypothetical protein
LENDKDGSLKNPQGFRDLMLIFTDEIVKKYTKHAWAIIALSRFLDGAETCQEKWQKRGSAYDDYERSLKLQDQIIESIQKTADFTAEVFLLGYAIILRYDVESAHIQEFIKFLRGHRKKPGVGFKDLVEKVFTMAENKWQSSLWGSDPRSEIQHVRNAFAHGHVKIARRKEIILWDKIAGVEGHTFDRVFSFKELGQLYSEFGLRLIILWANMMMIRLTSLNCYDEQGRYSIS